jgi:hypothetical protein
VHPVASSRGSHEPYPMLTYPYQFSGTISLAGE